MRSEIPLDTAMQLTSQAFLPYGCNARAAHDGQHFGFDVTDLRGHTVLSVASVSALQFSDPLRLAGVLEQARLDLAHQGRNLDPWSMPCITDPDVLPQTPPRH